MRNLLLAVLVLTSTSLFAQKKADEVAKFNVETFDFGKIKQNVPATATFIVTNISSEPLIIDQANPSCGCTVADYTKAPIAPGKTGYIKAIFNAADLGPIGKQITVKFANATDVKFLNFKGEVLANTAAPASAPAKKAPKKTSGK
ncbi:MAG: DUF1573 domain-containing protein [Ginsengibacter sp.]|jgi:hypothetical protein